MVALSCPHCGNKKNVIKFGTNRSGTARCRCLACKKTFTPAPRSRALPPEKEAAIERALAERVSQQGIARMLKVSRNTIRTVRKKGRSA
jgi:transposase-like protein